MLDTSVTLCGIPFKNPIIPASGTFGNGREFAEYYDLSLLGGISIKGLSMEPRLGNPPPRIAETPFGMLNSVGLQNNGVAYFLENDLPFLRRYDVRVIANIAGHTIEENEALAEALGDQVDMLELNVSCPNVKEGGVAFGTQPAMLEKITSAVKKKAKVPLIVKLSPNVTNIVEVAKAAESGGADCLSLINTLIGMRIDVNTRRPILRNITGGLSGPCVKPVGIRMVWQVANAVDLPIIGMGGISTGEDAAEYLLAGASAVSVGTANLIDPNACPRILRELEEYMTSHGVSSVSELVKGVKLD